MFAAHFGTHCALRGAEPPPSGRSRSTGSQAESPRRSDFECRLLLGQPQDVRHPARIDLDEHANDVDPVLHRVGRQPRLNLLQIGLHGGAKLPQVNGAAVSALKLRGKPLRRPVVPPCMERSLLRMRPANFVDCAQIVEAAALAPTAARPRVAIGASGIGRRLERFATELRREIAPCCSVSADLSAEKHKSARTFESQTTEPDSLAEGLITGGVRIGGFGRSIKRGSMNRAAGCARKLLRAAATIKACSGGRAREPCRVPPKCRPSRLFTSAVARFA